MTYTLMKDGQPIVHITGHGPEAAREVIRAAKDMDTPRGQSSEHLIVVDSASGETSDFPTFAKMWSDPPKLVPDSHERELAKKQEMQHGEVKKPHRKS